MRFLFPALGIFCALVLSAAAFSMALHGSLTGLTLFGGMALALLPGWTGLIGLPHARLLRGTTVAVLVPVTALWLAGPPPASIYRSPEVVAAFEAIYAEKLAEWPVAHESRFLDTRRGRVHVIVSGPPDAPPLFLLHASGMSGWSWIHNVEALSREYRTYAIDLIGDAGRSAYADLGQRMRTPEDQADHYAEVADLLGVRRTAVVGASEGGFIALNFARFHPDRVERLVLLGPMGLSGTIRAALRITFAQLFPLRPVQEATFRWAFSDEAALIEEFGAWFPLVMSGTFPAKVPPWPLSDDEKRQMRQPMLFVFGTRDNVVGDVAAAQASVGAIPGASAAIVEAGHLMASEAPDTINRLILDFLSEGAP